MTPGALLQDLLSSLFERRAWRPASMASAPIETLCEELLSGRGEVSGMRLAAAVLESYRGLDAEGRTAFFNFLTEDLDIDAGVAETAARAYRDDRGAPSLRKLLKAAEPRRQELLRRLNCAPGATADLVAMRADLLAALTERPSFARTDLDFANLFASWFNRGFLVLRRVDWSSPAQILEKIIAYEAVHEISTWDELRRRLHPEDRRCFAFFHPAMPDEPLVFVEVALTKSTPSSIQSLLSEDRRPMAVDEATTAVFYSISNCQAGLKGVSFGNSLIKQVVSDLSAELPHLETFVTLSPAPGLAQWLAREEDEAARAVKGALSTALDGDLTSLRAQDAPLKTLAARYFLQAKRADGRPVDPVARFHLGNGAILNALHTQADTSRAGLTRSAGVMVNYLYDPARVETNHERHAHDGAVIAAGPVEALLVNRS
ncbi:MAG: malonyl-CoA decarboxylase [Alphaproteobacteria bacterium]|nr:malonyl-CoA decarboxylase [Alphaproteobacteria bacterium]